jgi:hypothetical protein
MLERIGESLMDEKGIASLLTRDSMLPIANGCSLGSHHVLEDLPTAGLLDELQVLPDLNRSGTHIADDWGRYFVAEVKAFA